MKKELNVFETKDQSRKAYTDYVTEHIQNVSNAYFQFKDIIVPCVLKRNGGSSNETKLLIDVYDSIQKHDSTKFNSNEFDAYAAKFYPCEDDLLNPNRDQNFDKAWKHHYSWNKHHPEYWKVRINGEDTYITMDNVSFFEMILDWISVSMTNKSSVFDWWYNSKNGGKEEKEKMLPEQDIQIISDFITKYKDQLDFSSKA